MSGAVSNLIYNGFFEYFSNQTVDNSGAVDYHHPDGWVYSDTGEGGSITKVNESCSIVTSSGGGLMSFRQNLNEFPRWKSYLSGRSICARFRFSLPNDGVFEVSLSDGLKAVTRKYNVKGRYTSALVMQTDENLSSLWVEVSSQSSSATINIDSVEANLGEECVDFLPCIISGYIGERRQYITTQVAPPTELSLCSKAKEVGENQTRLNSVINHRFGTGSGGRSLLPDMRGYFSRAIDAGAGVDGDADTRKMLGNPDVTGDLVGTQEEDEFLQHSHALDFSSSTLQEGTVSSLNSAMNTTVKSSTDADGGTETRPKNISELYTIKWS